MMKTRARCFLRVMSLDNTMIAGTVPVLVS
ncbi:hypothetical protein EV190_10756 [Actinorugispora endophytica]|uniref:Uncharacterized protein n=1 Tax=Actinorugispora endophytica TaxID=1605990 RepID=A0A4R6V2B8_9ACTN|nr:hypothetical protein EV190_10756 [Actinorugispora endophytica]